MWNRELELVKLVSEGGELVNEGVGLGSTLSSINVAETCPESFP